MIKKTLILILIFASPAYLISAPGEIKITRCIIDRNLSSGFSLKYQIKNTFDATSFSSLQVTIPFEKYIIQGAALDGYLQEKDFLFSQMNIDLNGDSDFNDSFPVTNISDTLYIKDKKIFPINKTTSNYNVMIPFDKAGNFNLNRIEKNGKQFTLRDFSSKSRELTVGLNTEGDIEFKKFPNSILLIEVVTSFKKNDETLQIDGQTPFEGFTNEKELTGGENFYRYSSVKTVSVSDNYASGEIKITGITKPQSLRITYFFCISDNIILMNQKTVRIN